LHFCFLYIQKLFLLLFIDELYINKLVLCSSSSRGCLFCGEKCGLRFYQGLNSESFPKKHCWKNVHKFKGKIGV